jgi:type I restriction-modification system DNA methylase subunit
MQRKQTIKTKEYWSQQFGLYPMLMQPKISKNKFLMLNGGNKDFCLQTVYSDNEKNNFFAESWSTNTKFFLVINNDTIYIHNWLDKKSEKYDLKTISENSSKLYSYLSSKSYKTPDDAVPYIISIFRRLRNLIRKKQPEEALNLLFKLLISINDDYKRIDTSKWEISDVKIPPGFDYYVEQIRLGVNSISPNRDLILRHVAGVLFQEAHKDIIYFDPQMDLFAGFSDKLIANKNLYSSLHYTPHYLARSIVENCLKQLDLKKRMLKIFDPACGSSEFLIETLKQLKNSNYDGKVKIIGWDTSSSAVCTSKFLLKYEQLEQWDKSNLNFEIKYVPDSLTEQWDNDYDLIVMNPPFVSWELLNKKDRDSISDVLGSLYRGKPNQAVAFFYKAAKSLKKNGVLGCVLPTTLFTSDSYLNLRNEITENLSLNLLAKLGNYIFESALTDVSFFIGKKTEVKPLPQLIWSKNEAGNASEVLLDLRKMEAKNQMVIDEKKYNIYIPSRFPIVHDSWKIISMEEEKFLNDVNRFVSTGQLAFVSDIFLVRQGIRTGNNQAFIISRKEYTEIPKSEKKLYRKVITNDSIKNGVLVLNNYIWYPYDSNGIIINSEKEFKKTAPFSYKRLLQFKNILSKERARKDLNTWWFLSEHRAWLRKEEMRLYSTEFGKSDSFAIDKTGSFVAERGCAWIPKKTFANTDDYYFYLSVFSSDTFDFLLSIYSKQIQAGYYLGQAYTKNIPIPNVFFQGVQESEPYFRLVELGKELEAGHQYVSHSINDAIRIYYSLLDN